MFPVNALKLQLYICYFVESMVTQQKLCVLLKIKVIMMEYLDGCDSDCNFYGN